MIHQFIIKWRLAKYFRSQNLKRWIFFANVQDKKGNVRMMDLFKATQVPIKRHVKIKGYATPYDSAFRNYLERRLYSRKGSIVNTDRWWAVLKF
jgi:RNA-directed DNA polymerase